MGDETVEIMRGGSYVWTLGCEREETKGAMSRGQTELLYFMFVYCFKMRETGQAYRWW